MVGYCRETRDVINGDTINAATETYGERQSIGPRRRVTSDRSILILQMSSTTGQ